MTTYSWHNPAQTILQAVEEDGSVYLFNPEEGNPFYAKFLESGATAEPYVAPPEVEPEPTPLELLAARVTAIEANELSDDAVDSALLTLVADLTARVAALEAGA